MKIVPTTKTHSINSFLLENGLVPGLVNLGVIFLRNRSEQNTE